MSARLGDQRAAARQDDGVIIDDKDFHSVHLGLAQAIV